MSTGYMYVWAGAVLGMVAIEVADWKMLYSGKKRISQLVAAVTICYLIVITIKESAGISNL